jgi:hypothetical protein
MEFKRKKLLTRPVLKMEEGKQRAVLIEAAMFIGKDIKSRTEKPEDKKKEPATIVNVTNLETGELAQIVVNAVMKSILTEEYPDDTYVGKCFLITKMGRQPGKQYNPFHIEEIEDPRPAAKSVEDTVSAIKTSNRR